MELFTIQHSFALIDPYWHLYMSVNRAIVGSDYGFLPVAPFTNMV